jgi:uncharacterized protein YjbI with pentapeptide repeats
VKVIKPRTLGLLTRTFERDRKQHLVVSILAMSPFGSPSRLFPESELWTFATRALGPERALDDALPKPRGELLVDGSAFNVGGARPGCAVRVRLGPIDKTLHVVGDRVWPYDALTGEPSSSPTAPAPFVEMPLDWSRAYGGDGYPQNPLGRGYWTKATLANRPVPLPNVEHPRRPVAHPSDRAEPAGFGAYDLMWPQRFSKVGTHDAKWLEEQFPGFALDMDLGIFNAAPPDQQIEGYFRGDEELEVEGMHPARARVAGRLPALAARAFVTLRGADALQEVPMRLDTVRLFPNHERALVVFRGVVEVAEADADDVVHLLIAAERMGAAHPRSHYDAVLANRLDRKKGAAYALRDRDLVPDPDPDAPKVDGAFEDELQKLYEVELLQNQALERRGQKELAAVEDQIRAAGLDPAQWITPPAPEKEVIPEDPVDRAEYVEEAIARAKKTADEAAAEAEARARAACEAAGVDYDAAIARARAEAGGPPKFSAEAELTRLRCIAELLRIGGEDASAAEAQASDPAVAAKLVALEKQLFAIYRGYAHHYPPAQPADAERSRLLREEVAAARAGGTSLRGRDLTGADLSGVDLGGLDLEDALLEGANLAGARLAGAKLAGAVLTRAALGGVVLDAADLTRANLGGADLAGASLREATLVRAVLTGAVLDGAALDGATLDDADLTDTALVGASLADAKAARVTFSNARLERVSFARAAMPRARFLECTLEEVTFAGARLEALTLMNVSGKGVVFDRAVLDNLRCVQRCDLSGARFEGASLLGANLREAVLEGARLRGARLSGADLSKANLAGADLRGVVAREARFDRTDLTGADLRGIDCLLGSLRAARVGGADLGGSSLFGADLLHLSVDRGTKLEGAELGRTRFVARRTDRGS